jgi:uncharacterized membrane protein
MESAMEMKMKHISHKLIDSLSDGVFSIALTLLGLNVVALVPDISHSKNVNSAILNHWPTFLSYLLGFVVLFSMWYQYHSFSQYVTNTNAFVVWTHGMTMAWVALVPFGVALLAENLNTPNRKWGIFYFGICLFGQYWSWVIMSAFIKYKFPITFSDDLPLPAEKVLKMTTIIYVSEALLGILLVALSLAYPWLALAGYGLFILTNVNPVKSMNKAMPMLSKYL